MSTQETGPDTPEKIVQDALDSCFTTKPMDWSRIGQSVFDGATARIQALIDAVKGQQDSLTVKTGLLDEAVATIKEMFDNCECDEPCANCERAEAFLAKVAECKGVRV